MTKRTVVVSVGGEYLVVWYGYTGDRVRVTRNMTCEFSIYIWVYILQLQGDGMVVPSGSLMVVVTYLFCRKSSRG